MQTIKVDTWPSSTGGVWLAVIKDNSHCFSIDSCRKSSRYSALQKWDIHICDGAISLPKENTTWDGNRCIEPFWAMIWYRQRVRFGPCCAHGFGHQSFLSIEFTDDESDYWCPDTTQAIDPLYYSVYADFLDERGDNRASGFRTLAAQLTLIHKGRFKKKHR